VSKATEKTKKQLNAWRIAHLGTEYGPISGGLITAMVMNPHVWEWLLFVLLGVLIIGGLIAAFKHSGKTIIWGIILVLVFAVNGLTMYIIVGTCFLFAASNDLLIYPKYKALKEKYVQFRNQDEYMALNGGENGTKQ
jgi:cell division protein FtsW (lipid II flippase)